MVLMKRWGLSPAWIAFGIVAASMSGCTDDDSSAEDGTTTMAMTTDGPMTQTTATTMTTMATTAGMTDASGDDTAGTDDAATTSGSSGTADDTTAGTDDGEDAESSSSTSMGVDDNDTANVEPCEAPGNLVSCDAPADNPTIFNALGLNCAGGPDEAIPIVGEGFNYSDPGSWAIAAQFGTYIDPGTNEPIWGPHEGVRFLAISSGQVGTPNANGALPAQGDDFTANPDYKPLPAPMSPLPGAPLATPFVNCDGINDCSNSLQQQWNAGGGAANDLLWFQFSTQVPNGTHGFSIDFAYFSEEFPEWVGTVYNDMFVVWSNSETYTGNLCFVDDQPCTVTALWPTQFQNNAAQLQGTGFSFDGGTGWFQIKGSAAPAELLQLTFAIFDMGDTVLDTYVLLDNFAWDCEGCTPTEVNPCGVIPQ